MESTSEVSTLRGGIGQTNRRVDSLSGDINNVISALGKLTERLPPAAESTPINDNLGSDRGSSRINDPRPNDPSLLSVSMEADAVPSDPDIISQSPVRNPYGPSIYPPGREVPQGWSTRADHINRGEIRLSDLRKELPGLAHFSGEADTWDEFTGIFELRVDHVTNDDDWRFKLIEASLEKDALRFYLSIRSRTYTYAQLKRQLVNQFAEVLDERTWRARLNSTAQESGESPSKNYDLG